MGYDPESNTLKPLKTAEEVENFRQKTPQFLFTEGEAVSVKGVKFKMKEIGEHRIILTPLEPMTAGERQREEFNAENQREKAKIMDGDCYNRAKKRGDQTFTLVGQDVSSPQTICFWIMMNIESIPAAKAIDALKDALAMRDLTNRKHPD